MTDISIEQVLADNNLLQAWYKVRANQGCAGVDHVGIQDFERKLFSKLALLKDEVIYTTYRPLPLLRIHVPKKSGGLRALSIPAVRDRVLHTAVALILTPVFDAEFEECSYAYRQGRSVDMAVRRIEQLRDQGFVWVVDADIHSYFDEIDHNRLLGLVRELVTDPSILHLIQLWLKAVVVDGKRRFTLDKGVPQGSPLSPLLANLYLDKLDEAMLGKDLRIIRFADDFLILCRDKKRAQKAMEFTVDILESLNLISALAWRDSLSGAKSPTAALSCCVTGVEETCSRLPPGRQGSGRFWTNWLEPSPWISSGAMKERRPAPISRH